MSKNERIFLGAFAGAHGVHGDVRIKAFTQNPRDIAAYGPVTTEAGSATFTLTVKKTIKGDFVLARAPEITSREMAESLKGTKFYVARSALPDAEEDEFYVEDLIGLTAQKTDGTPFGRVKAVHNFGAGDILELVDIPERKGTLMVAFTLAAVPTVDLDASEITIADDALGEDETPD